MDQQEIFMTALRQVAQLCAVAAMTAPKERRATVSQRRQAVHRDGDCRRARHAPAPGGMAAGARHEIESSRSGFAMPTRRRNSIWCCSSASPNGIRRCMTVVRAVTPRALNSCGPRPQYHTEEAEDWEFPGPICQLRCIDLGIAVGSAAKMASLNNVDARCQTRIAAAARHLGMIEADLAVALSMSVSHKNIFFDKKMPDMKFDEQPPA